ncbi:hypothetical protein HMI56_000213 [Coelomomyces lativittatus]|nr:hypothetical protein HMI56_000213 [Coelomomyces lativittatus]
MQKTLLSPFLIMTSTNTTTTTSPKCTRISESLCFNGQVIKYRHDAATVGCSMNFNVFLPPGYPETNKKYPALLFLSGLTCTEDNFFIKSGAQQMAAQYGLILLSPDTSPRGTGCKDEAVSWEFGLGASYYVDATYISIFHIGSCG